MELYSVHNHRIKDRIIELANKKRESTGKHRISWNWPLLDWNSVFGRKRNIFVQGEIPGGPQMCRTTQASLHRHSHSLPELRTHEAAAQEASKVGWKTMNLITLSKTQCQAVSEQLPCIRWQAVLQILSTYYLEACRYDHLFSKALVEQVNHFAANTLIVRLAYKNRIKMKKWNFGM